MPWNHCAVKNCVNQSVENKSNLSFHRFPSNSAVRSAWIKFCNQSKGWSPVTGSTICSVHFSPDNFELNFRQKLLNKPSRTMLKKNAVPWIINSEEKENFIKNNIKKLRKDIVSQILSGSDSSLEMMESSSSSSGAMIPRVEITCPPEPTPTEITYAVLPTLPTIQLVPLQYTPIYCIPNVTNYQPNSTQTQEVPSSSENNKHTEITTTEHDFVEQEIEIGGDEPFSRIKYEIHTTTDEIQTNDAIFLGEKKEREMDNIMMVKYSIQEEHKYARYNSTESETGYHQSTMDENGRLVQSREKKSEHNCHNKPFDPVLINNSNAQNFLPATVQMPVKSTSTGKITWYTCDTCSFRTRMRDSLQFHVQSKSHKDAVDREKEELETMEKVSIKEEFCTEREESAENWTTLKEEMDFDDVPSPVEEFRVLGETHSEKTGQKIEVEEAVVEKEEIHDIHHVMIKQETPHEATDEEGAEEVEVKYKCPHCKYKTNWKNNLTKHVTSRHTPSDKIDWLHCAHCPFKAKVRENLIKHWRFVHNNRSPLKYLRCERCSYKTKYAGLLRNHMITAHTRPDDIKWWPCAQCDFRAKLKSRLTWHVKSKHKPLWLSCRKCHYKTTDKNLLQSHVKTHDKIVRWFRCRHCPHQSYLLGKMEAHARALHGMGALSLDFMELSFSPKTPMVYERGACFAAEGEGVRCGFCGFSAGTSVEVQNHIVDCHNLVLVV